MKYSRSDQTCLINSLLKHTAYLKYRGCRRDFRVLLFKIMICQVVTFLKMFIPLVGLWLMSWPCLPALREIGSAGYFDSWLFWNVQLGLEGTRGQGWLMTRKGEFRPPHVVISVLYLFRVYSPPLKFLQQAEFWEVRGEVHWTIWFDCVWLPPAPLTPPVHPFLSPTLYGIINPLWCLTIKPLNKMVHL